MITKQQQRWFHKKVVKALREIKEGDRSYKQQVDGLSMAKTKAYDEIMTAFKITTVGLNE